MNSSIVLRTLASIASIAFSLAAGVAMAHGYSAGDVRIRHPFATPTPPGATIGAAYFASLENQGAQADRLLRASTPVATKVEMHSGDIGADGVMRMRELEGGLKIPAKAVIKLRPGMGDHLMLMGLKKPLVEGETFPMTLEFEHAGKVEVKVTVQVPKDRGAMPMDHGMSGGAHKH
jgi:copper(I)-binding protein